MKFILLLYFCMLTIYASSQSYPVVGKKVSDFELKEVHYNNSRSVNASKLKGKHVILDFWSKSCGSCIASFPKVNELQRKFKDDLKVILVGFNDRPELIKKLYELQRAKHSLDLTIAYDTAIFTQFEIGPVPLLVWIDEAGTVRAVTNGTEMNEGNINKFLKGEQFEFTDKSFETLAKIKSDFNPNMPFLLGGNGGDESKYLYRSIITKWERGMPQTSNVGINNDRTRSIEIIGATLKSFYEYAFNIAYRTYDLSDNFYKNLIYETKDSLLFIKDSALYAYSLSPGLGAKAGKRLLTIMQRDIEDYFGYTATIEERELPCYKLIIRDHSKIDRLKAKGVKRASSHWTKQIGGEIYDGHMKGVAGVIAGDLKPLLNIYDETGITHNIDIKIDTDLSDIKKIRTALAYYGLDIVQERKAQKALVISDN